MSPKHIKQCGPLPASKISETGGTLANRRALMPTNLNNPQEISEKGQEIYTRLYKTEYERSHPGEYVAIGIGDESASLGKTGSEALAEAKRKNPHGFFHLIRVGHLTAFEVGLAYRNVNTNRLHR